MDASSGDSVHIATGVKNIATSQKDRKFVRP